VTPITTTSWREAIRLFLADTTKTIAVVPSVKWANETHSISVNNGNCALGRKAYTLKELVTSFSPPSTGTINKRFQLAIIHRLLSSAKTKYFKTSSVATSNAFLSAISRLKKNLIASKQLKKILSTRGGPKEEDLLNIYGEYEKYLRNNNRFDEDDIYIKFDAARLGGIVPYIVGFDPVPPVLEHYFKKSRTFNIEPERKKEPSVFALNSPYHETTFVTEKITELINADIAPKEIVVHAGTGDETAREIAEKWTGTAPFSLLSSNLAKKIFNRKEIPIEGYFHEYCGWALNVMEEEAEKIVKTAVGDMDRYPFVSARTLNYIGSLKRLLEELMFGYKTVAGDIRVGADDFFEVLHQELSNTEASLPETPFRIASFDMAGLYESSVSIIPAFNHGKAPPLNAETFFNEPDTLAKTGETKIDRIFLRSDDIIRLSRNRLASALSKDTIISYHRHTSSGADASPSILLLKYPKRERAEKTFRTINFTARRDAVGSVLRSEPALKLLSKILKDKPFSATKLETYGNCPFAYFVKYILGIEPPDEITPEVQPKDRGTLIHESLEEFFVTYGKIYINIKSDQTDKIRPLISDAVDKVFDRRSDITSKYHKEMTGHLRERSKLLLGSVLSNELIFMETSTQRPSRFEEPFLDELKDGIFLKGVIDRIDEDEVSFTVIDYKTGSVSPVRSGIENGTKLQMPLYSEMARRILKKKPSAAFLYSIKERKRKTGIVNETLKANVYGERSKGSRLIVKEEEWNRLMRTGIDTAVNYANRIKNGDFAGKPVECPAYCEFKDVCGFR